MDSQPSTSGCVAPKCYLCIKTLLRSRDRCTLQHHGAAEVNLKVLRFLLAYVAEEAVSVGEKQYLCKPCFSLIDKAARSLELAEESINKMRTQVLGESVLPIHLVAVERGSPVTSDRSSGSEEEAQGGGGAGRVMQDVNVTPRRAQLTPTKRKRRRNVTSPVALQKSRRTVGQASPTVVKVNFLSLF